MWYKIGYAMGYALGLAFFYGLYALGFWGVYSDISDKKLPLLPLTYLFVLLTWRKFSYFTKQLDDFIKSVNDMNQQQARRVAETQKVFNQLNKFGGPN